MLKRAGLAAGSRFVEFGCGLGYVTRWASSEGAHATGIDANEEQIMASRQLAGNGGFSPSFQVGDVYDPGLEPESFDIAYCRLSSPQH